MAIEKILETSLQDAKIENLSDRPNEVSDKGQGGLSARALKERFDAFPRVVKNKLNEIIALFNSGEYAENTKIPIDDIKTLSNFLSYFDPNVKKDIGALICAMYKMRGDTENKKYTFSDIVSDIFYNIQNLAKSIKDVADRIASLDLGEDKQEIINDLIETCDNIIKDYPSFEERLKVITRRVNLHEQNLGIGNGSPPPVEDTGKIEIKDETGYVLDVPEGVADYAYLDRYYGDSYIVDNYSPIGSVALHSGTADESYEFVVYPPPGKYKISCYVSLEDHSNFKIQTKIGSDEDYSNAAWFGSGTCEVNFDTSDRNNSPPVKILLSVHGTREYMLMVSAIKVYKDGAETGGKGSGIYANKLNEIRSSTGDIVTIPNFGYNDKMYSGNYVDFSEKVFRYETRFYKDENCIGWVQINSPSADYAIYSKNYYFSELGVSEGSILRDAKTTHAAESESGFGLYAEVVSNYITVKARVHYSLSTVDAFTEYMKKIGFCVIYSLKVAPDINVKLDPSINIDSAILLPVEPGGELVLSSEIPLRMFRTIIYYVIAEDSGGDDEGGAGGETPPGDESPYDLEGEAGDEKEETKTAYMRRVPSNVTENAELFGYSFDTIMNYNISPIKTFNLISSLIPSENTKEIELYFSKTGTWEVSFDADMGIMQIGAYVMIGDSYVAEYTSAGVEGSNHSFDVVLKPSDGIEIASKMSIVFYINGVSSPAKTYTIDNICIIPKGEYRTSKAGYPISVAPKRFIGANGSEIVIPALTNSTQESAAYKFDNDFVSHVDFTSNNTFKACTYLCKDAPKEVTPGEKWEKVEGAAPLNAYAKEFSADRYFKSDLLGRYLTGDSVKPNVFSNRREADDYSRIGYHSKLVLTGDGTKSVYLTLIVPTSIDSVDKLTAFLYAVNFNFLVPIDVPEAAQFKFGDAPAPNSRILTVDPGNLITIESNVAEKTITSTMKYMIAEDSTGGGEDPTPPEGGDDPTPPDDGGDEPTPPEGGDEPSNPDDGGDKPPTVEPEETPPDIKDEYELEGTVGKRVSEVETAYVRRVPSNVGETAILSIFYYDTIMNYNIAPVNDLELAPDSPSKTITIYPHKTGQWEVSFYVDVGVHLLRAKALVGNSVIASYESTSVNNGDHSFSFYYDASPQSEAYHDVVELVFSMDTPFEESYIISRICVVPQGERRTAETGYPISVAPIRFVGSDGKSPTFGAIPAVRESDVYKFDDDYCSYRTFNGTLKSAFARRATLVTDRVNAVFGEWKMNEAGAAYRKVNVFEKDIKTSWFSVTGLSLAESIKPNVFTERIDSKTNYVSLGHLASIYIIDGVEYLRLRLNVHKQIDTIDKFKEYINSIKFNFLVKANGNYTHETETTEGSKVISVTPGGTILIESNIPNHPIKSEISYLITEKDSGGEL